MAEMAKTTAKAAKMPTVATVVTPADMATLQQVFKVAEGMSEEQIIRADGLPGVRLEFDYVYFRKLSDDFVATLKAHNQKAYWLAYGEFSDRDRRSNVALHDIGVDPLSKILDRPRGRNNPLVRDGEHVQAIMGKDWYVTWRVQGGEGDLTGALEAGFQVIRRPVDPKEEKAKGPFDWSGEVWKIRDGTSDPTSGEEIFNVMVAIRRRIWDDNLKAMSMVSHNAYSQNKRQFIEGAENISRDMLGAKEKIMVQDLDETHIEEHTEVREGKRVHVDS
jgi:hypothetical protein